MERRMCFEFGGLQHQASTLLVVRGRFVCMYTIIGVTILNKMAAIVYYDPLRKPCG